MNLYNVMVYYNGEGTTNIFLPVLGELNITNGRPIYLKNVGYNVIEVLRQFRKMLIDIKPNAKPDGAYRVIDFSELNTFAVRGSAPVQRKVEAVSDSDISSVLSSGSKGPIVLDEPKKEEPKTNVADFKLPSGQFEGKTLAEVDKMGKLKSVYNGFKTRNPEVKEAIEKYYESQVNK